MNLAVAATRKAFVIACTLLATASCGAETSAWEALPLGTKADFSAVWFADAMHGWIGGGSYQITGGLVGRTSDGGKTWRYVSNLTAHERMSVPALHFFDTDRGIAATSSGVLLATSDGGETWEPVQRKGRAGHLSTMFFLDARLGWAAGTGDVIRTQDAGEQWASSENVDNSYRSPICAVQFADARNGWAAGMQSYLARTSDAGATWERVATPIVGTPAPTFWDLTFVDSQYGWVVGEEGALLSTTDGGNTWTRRSTGLEDAQSEAKLARIPTAGGSVMVDVGERTPGFTISAVRFVDRDRGFLAGYYANLGRSLILRTEDAGATWHVDADIAGEGLRALFIQGRDTAWAIGSRVREGQQAIYCRSLGTK